jgi:signal transduction histidine kinase
LTFQKKEVSMIIIRDITTIIMNERFRNYNKYLELLTNTVSHEMLTPLNSIINLSKMINEKILKE